jgi:hypothetical protein
MSVGGTPAGLTPARLLDSEHIEVRVLGKLNDGSEYIRYYAILITYFKVRVCMHVSLCMYVNP